MPDATLSMLLDAVRAKSLRRLEGVGEAEARWVPQGLQNTILWHSGHVLMVVERLSCEALGKSLATPPGWFELFGWDSQPAAIAAERRPSLEAVRAELILQRERLGASIRELTSDQLDRPSQSRAEWTVRFAIMHGLHDEACHSGEIWLLRKLYERQGR